MHYAILSRFKFGSTLRFLKNDHIVVRKTDGIPEFVCSALVLFQHRVLCLLLVRNERKLAYGERCRILAHLIVHDDHRIFIHGTARHEREGYRRHPVEFAAPEKAVFLEISHVQSQFFHDRLHQRSGLEYIDFILHKSVRPHARDVGQQLKFGAHASGGTVVRYEHGRRPGILWGRKTEVDISYRQESHHGRDYPVFEIPHHIHYVADVYRVLVPVFEFSIYIAVVFHDSRHHLK